MQGTDTSLEGRLDDLETIVESIEYVNTAFFGDLPEMGCTLSLTTAHECDCNGETFPVIVNEGEDGTTNSVELYDKKFSAAEWSNLKTIILSEFTSETTYDIFLALDAKTFACEHRLEYSYDEQGNVKEIKSFDINSETNTESGISVVYEEDYTMIATYSEGQLHGWMLESGENMYAQTEMRMDQYVGLSTTRSNKNGAWNNNTCPYDENDLYEYDGYDYWFEYTDYCDLISAFTLNTPYFDEF